MAFEYNTPDNDVRTRAGLSPSIRETLLQSERSSWPDHPRFGGKAAFFLEIHQALLHGSAHLVGGLQALIDEPKSTLEDVRNASALQRIASDLTGYAHHHHHMEDAYYFPAFARILPKLNHALALLDGDHRALEEALGGAEASMRELGASSISRDRIGKALDRAAALEKIIARHLYDEEDIIIPIFLIAA